MQDLATRLVCRVHRLLAAEEQGATAVEYAVMVAAIIAVVMTVVFSIGQGLIPGFETVNNGL